MRKSFNEWNELAERLLNAHFRIEDSNRSAASTPTCQGPALPLMKYLGFIPFIGFAIAEALLRSDMNSRVKKRAFRWCVVLSALSFLVVMPLTGLDLGLVIAVIPVLALISFIFIRYTKFCEWCGWAVRTNLPFVDKEHCPRCNSALS